jgi:hypothetical protein
MSKLNALVLSVNDFLNTALITTHGCTYGCPTKTVNGELFFRFLNEWHSVAEYAGENTTIISDLGNGLVRRKFK